MNIVGEAFMLNNFVDHWNTITGESLTTTGIYDSWLTEFQEIAQIGELSQEATHFLGYFGCTRTKAIKSPSFECCWRNFDTTRSNT